MGSNLQYVLIFKTVKKKAFSLNTVGNSVREKVFLGQGELTFQFLQIKILNNFYSFNFGLKFTICFNFQNCKKKAFSDEKKRNSRSRIVQCSAQALSTIQCWKKKKITSKSELTVHTSLTRKRKTEGWVLTNKNCKRIHLEFHCYWKAFTMRLLLRFYGHYKSRNGTRRPADTWWKTRSSILVRRLKRAP